MSATVYGIVRTVHPPTAVDDCCSCHFFSHDEENLVVVGSNWLHVFRIVSEEKADGTDFSKPKPKLEAGGSFHLFGNIESVSALRLPQSPRDILILSFRDAKLSVVEYDPSSCDLVTLSLHYFEEDDLKSGLYSNIRKPVVRVDPDLRCVAMLAYGCQLIVIPLRKDVNTDEHVTSKSPFAPSYIIDLSKTEDKIHNIKDIQFLHGYYEPTMFILYEPIRTWAGRVPVRKDTCKIAAMSLNMQEKVHPVIWSMDNLPFDCCKTLPLPKPIGGVLVIATTSLIYMNQSVPPYAVSLTSISDTVTQFPMKPQSSVSMTLDNCHLQLISSDQVIISTKTGEIFVLTVCLDSMRAVKQFQIDKAASSVLPSCICLVGEGFLFLGSRLGNSLLLKYVAIDSQDKSEDAADAAMVSPDSKPEANKKDASTDWVATDAADLEKELDELEVYGSSDAQTGEDQITLYQFQVCDSMMNIAPCGRINLGEPAFLSEELNSLCQIDHDLELISTSGYGKNGALTFMQRTIRPQIITTFQLPDVREMWTVRGPINADNVQEGEQSSLAHDMHSYLILGKEDSTMVLQTTDDISELDQSGFNTNSYTVFAGNIGTNYTVQVTADGVRLLLGVKQLQALPLQPGSAVSAAWVCDPYLLVKSEQGLLMLLQLESMEGDEARLVVLKQLSEIDLEVSTACLYRDVSGLFTCESKYKTSSKNAAPTSLATNPAPRLSVSLSEDKTLDSTVMEEDEDELLYGDSEINITLPDVSTSADIPINANEPAAISQTKNETVIVRQSYGATYWLVVATKANDLQIYSLPDLKLVFRGRKLTAAERVMSDVSDSNTQTSDAGGVATIVELLVTGLGSNKHKPFVFARSISQAVIVYEVMHLWEPGAEDRLQIQLRKFDHKLILRERRRVARKRVAESDSATKAIQYAKTLLQPFDNIGGYSGVFLGGAYPHWFILSSKGVLRCHPMGIDNGIVCASSFHNINCPHGFVYFNKQDELRISILPAHLSYEHQWPLRKVPLKTTVHSVKYDPESKVYVMVCSRTEQAKKLVKIENDEKQFIEQDRDDRFVFPSKEVFFVQLFSPINCEPIPGTMLEFEEGEAITCLEILSLCGDGQSERNFIGVPTNNSFNEEVTSKGRLLIYEIIDVVPEPGMPLTKNKLKEIYAKEQKGPVTAITSTDGMLVAAIGQKVYVYQLKDNDLVGMSFIDSQIYIHQMVSIKTLILIADIHMSISVLRYQSEHRVLSTVSRDTKPNEVYSVEFFVDNTTLGFIATDRDQNLMVYLYQPEASQSSGGTILLKKADINIGSSVNSLCRVRCKLTDPTTDTRFSGITEKRHVTYFGTIDGGIGYLLPLAERVYRRLDMTQKLLSTMLPHTAALNPRTYRSIKTQKRALQNAQHNLIDGDLVWKYLGLPHAEQLAVAKRMGTTPDQITEDLLEIDRTTTHF